MLEEKKARDTDHPKTSNINNNTCNLVTYLTSNDTPNSGDGTDPARRFALQLEHCSPSPGPGPLTSPRLGGLLGSSLLIGQQTAFFQLTQLEAQLATQINNAFSVGSRIATLTANSNSPAPFVPPTPPSPTAAAISLLNLLKIVNTMSHPLYNPYASGNQRSTQGQYGHSNIQPGGDGLRTPSHLGPGSSFNSSGGSSSASAKPPGQIPPLMSKSVSYRPEQSRAIIDEDIERSIDLHISRAREEVRFLGKPTHPSVNQSTRFANTQFLASSTGMSTFPMSSTSTTSGQRHTNAESASSSLDWLSTYKKPTVEDSSTFYSSAPSSSYASSSDGRFISSEKESNLQSIPGLGDCDFSTKTVTSESTRPKYTSESAANILLHFGLEKEDLEHLISYPEDQITPANLPFILRQIRLQKTKKTPASIQSKPYSEPNSSRSIGKMDSLSTSGMAGMRKEEMAVLQPSKVIDYGHTGKYTGTTGDEIGRTTGSRSNSSGSGSTLLMDAYDSSHSRKSLKNKPTEGRNIALDSSREQGSSIPNLRSSYRAEIGKSELSSVAPPSSDLTKRLQNQQIKQSSQTIQSSFSLPKKDTDIRGLKPEAFKSLTSKESHAGSQSTSKAPTSCTLFRDVHPSRPGLVVIGSSSSSPSNDQNKTKVQGSAEQMKKQQQHVQHQAVSQMGKVLWPQVFQATKPTPVPPASLNTTSLNASHAMARSVFLPGTPCPIAVSSAPPQAIPSLFARAPMVLPSSQPPATVPVSKGLPTAAMMQDYAAATPRNFPHTCSLCKKEYGRMKDWISHQNTSLHLESCKLLRAKYPEWDGEIVLRPSAAGKDANPQPSSSALTSEHRHQKTRRGRSSRSDSRSRSRSRSRSPRQHHGTDGRRAKRSRSRSPRSSRYSRRSRSRSPWHERQTTTRYRSRSKSHERWPSPRRRDEKRSSPRRSKERRLSPRSHEHRSPQRKNDARRSSPRKTRESCLSSERLSPQHKRSSSAERLAKKLLEQTAGQSLSKQSELEAVVKSLAPALLAELAKIRSSTSSGSMGKGGKSSRPSLTVKDKSSTFAASSSASLSTAKKISTITSKPKPSPQRATSSASTKTKLIKTSPPTMVKLGGICSSLSHGDVTAAVEQFGKTKSVVLFRSKLEAIVCFEKEEDAKKLKSISTFDIKEMPVSVVCKKVNESNEQTKSPQKKPAPKPSTPAFPQAPVCKPKTKKVPGSRQLSCVKKSSVMSSGKNTTVGKLSKDRGAKSSANVTKAKALISKAKNVSAEQKSKADKSANTAPTKPKQKVLATNVSATSKTSAGNSPQVRTVTKQKEEKETAKDFKLTSGIASKTQKDTEFINLKDTDTKMEKSVALEESVAVPEDIAKVVEMGNVSLFESVPQADLLVDVKEEKAEQMEVSVGETSSETTEPMDVESSDHKGENMTNDLLSKHSEGPSSHSTAETKQDNCNQFTAPSQSTEAAPKSADPSTHSPQTTSETPDTFVKAPLQVPESTLNEQEPTSQLQKPGSLPKAAMEAELGVTGLEMTTKQDESPAVVAIETTPTATTDSPDVVTCKTQPTATTGSPAVVVSEKLPTATTESSTSSEESPLLVASETTPKETTESPASSKESSLPCVTSLTVKERVNLKESNIMCFKHQTCFKKKFPFLGYNVLFITNLPEDGCYTEEDVANLLIPSGFLYKDQALYVIPQTCMAFAMMPSPVNAQHVLKRTMGKMMAFKGVKVKISVVSSKIITTPLGFYMYVLKQMKLPAVHGARLIYISNISASETRDLEKVLENIDFVSNYFPLLNKVFIEFESVYGADRLGVWYSQLKQAPNYQIYRLKVPENHFKAQRPVLPAFVGPDGRDIVFETKSCVLQGCCAPFWVMLKCSPFVFPTACPWFTIPKLVTFRTMIDFERAKSQGAPAPTVMLTGLPEGHYKHNDVASLVWGYFPKQSLTALYYNIIVLPLQRRAFVHFISWNACRNFVRDHVSNRLYVRGARLTIHLVLEQMHLESKEEILYANLMKWSNALIPDLDSLEKRLLCVEISETSVDIVKLVLEMVSSIAPFVSFLPLANRICVEMADSSGVKQVLESYTKYSPDTLKKSHIWSKVVNFECLKSLKQRLEESSEIKMKLEDKPAAVTDQRWPSPAEPSDTSSRPVIAGSSATATSKFEEFSQSTPAVAAKENQEKLPLIDENTFNLITAAVRKHRLRRETTEQHSDKKSKSKSMKKKEEPKKGDQVDFTDDDVSSHAYFFDEFNFNMEDFVTVDEVGEDMEDTSPDHHSSSSSRTSSREISERQSSDVSSTANQDSKSSASSLSSSSTSSKIGQSSIKRSPSSNITSVSTTKPSTSAKSSRTSVSSSSLSTESSPSLNQKQQSNAKCPGKPTTEAFDSVKTASLKEKAKTSDDTETKFEHKVSLKGNVAKKVESETKELLFDMHPPAHFQSAQNDDMLKEKKTIKEGKEEYIGKYTKEEMDDGENLQMHDSLDEQMDYGGEKSKLEIVLPQFEHGLGFLEEGFQVLDSVDYEAKICPEETSEIETDPLFQVLDSITEEQAATPKEDSPLVKDDTSTLKIVSEQDLTQVVSKSNSKPTSEDTRVKYQEEKDGPLHLLDPRSKEEGNEKKHSDEVNKIMLSEQSSNDMKIKPDNHIQNEDQFLENHDKDLFSNVNKQEAFEVLDSIDDQMEMEEDSVKLQTPSELMSKEDIRPAIPETDLENDKENGSKKGEAMIQKDDIQDSSRRSSPRSNTSQSEEKEKSPKKQDGTVKKYETRTKMEPAASTSKTGSEITEEMFKIVDSVKDDPVQNEGTTERSGRRRSARGKRDDKMADVTEKASGGKGATYKVLDSVDDEASSNDTTITTRFTRGRRERMVNRDLSSEKSKKEDTLTRRKHTPKKEEKASLNETSPMVHHSTKTLSEEHATYEILHSVEEEVKKDPPAIERKGRRGRPRKDANATKKGSVAIKKGKKGALVKVANEEEVTYEILDSVEDEVVDNETPTERTETVRSEDSKNEDEHTENSRSYSGPPRTEDEEEEEPMYQIVDSLEEGQEDRSQDNKCETLATTSTLVNLDEVSEEEEDYPDDTAEKEELRRRQASTKDKHLTKEKTRGTEERERRSRSSSSGGLGEGIEGISVSRVNEKEMFEVDDKELLTLDEVGGDEGGEERLQEGQDWDADISEADLQALVTLDEIVEEEEEGLKVEESTVEDCVSCKEDKSEDSLNPEALVTLDETGDDEEEKLDGNQAEKTSAKRKHDDTEENMNYVTVDEVGELEEEAEKQVVTRTRGRPKKRTRQTPVSKSTRGRNICAKVDGQEKKELSCSDAPPYTLRDSSVSLKLLTLSDCQAGVALMKQSDINATSAGKELEPEQPENQSHEECVEQGEEEKEGWKVASKRTKEPFGPEAKRSRSQSPCVVADFKLPPFNPSNPLGQEFVVPKSGFYCNICSVFYLNESSAKDLHCSSQRHYDNLQKYYQKLQQKPSLSTQNSEGLISE